MDTTENSDDKRIEDEYRDVVAGLRSVPPVGPRLAFRLKVAWRSRATTGLGKEPATGILGKKRTAWPPLARAAAVAMLAVLIGAIIFFGLTLLAGGSHPGEALYVFKVAREKISMAFTGGPVATAEKSLELAQERLKELDYFVSKKHFEPEKIEYIAEQYNRHKIQVQKVIAQKGTAPDGKMLASQLENLETQKEGILSRMSAAAGTESILTPAAGARVRLLDPSGSPSLGDKSSNVSGEADSAGKFEFDYTSPDKSRTPEIEATVELDGQKTTVPLVAPGGGEPIRKGRLEVRVEPRRTDLILGQTEHFVLTLDSKGGKKLGGTRMALEDRSGASLIDGQSGTVELAADDDGRCAFTVTKTSGRVSRISLGVFDGTRVEMGDILALGATEKVTGDTTRSGVTVRVTRGAGGANGVELDNGVVRVTADGDKPPAIIRTLILSGRDLNLGTFEDTLSVPGQPGVQGTVEMSAPRVVYANSDSAAYEIDVRATIGLITLRRIYRVSLAEGNEFVLISCKTSVESNKRLEQSKTYGTGSVPGIRMPRGQDAKIGGIPAEDLTGAEQEVTVSFDVTRPYVTFKSGGKGAVLCYPTRGPDSWSVDNNYIYTAFSENTLTPGITFETTSFLGFSEESGVSAMINEALQAQTSFPTESPRDIAEQLGFEIECAPSLENLEPGRRRFTLTIRKRYEKLSDYF